MRKENIVFLRSNPIKPDPRVEKEAVTLYKNGFDVIAVGWDREDIFEKIEESNFGKINRIKVKARFGTGIRNIRHLIKWNIVLFLWLFRNRKKYDLIHACDFDTIIPAILIKGLLKKKVVYDIFDFYSDMLRKVPSSLRRVIKAIDFRLIGLADAVIIADESRKEQIKGSKPKKLVVIYNSPANEIDTSKNSYEKSYTLIIGYVGLLQIERGIIEVINVVKRHPDWKLILAGFGGDEDVIISYCEGLPNVEFLGRVSYEKALKIYSIGDVLFATYDPSIPNHRYSSANKLFEAMMLGKPIIVARNTGMDLIVEKYKLGFVVDYGDSKQIESALIEISTWDEYKLQEFSGRVKMVYKEQFAWNIMEQRLTKLYTELRGEK